jgi:hypothetical protein
LTRVFKYRSLTYLFGTVGGVVAFGAVVFAYVDLRPAGVVPAVVFSAAAAIAALATSFAAGRGRVRLQVDEDVVEVSRLLRPKLRIAREGMRSTVRFADDRDLNPGPVLIKDKKKSEAVRRAILALRDLFSDPTSRGISGSAMEDFAVLRFDLPDGRSRTVLLPGPAKLEELGDLVGALDLESAASDE